MNAFLTLPTEVEARYWQAPETQRQLAIIDTCGLALGLIINGALTLAHWREKGLTAPPIMFWFAVAQLPQLLLLAYRRPFYMKYRTLITLLQRVRWFIGVRRLLCQDMVLTMELLVPVHHSMARMGTWKAVLAMVGYINVPALLSSLNHPLGFKLQLLMALCLFVAEAGALVHQTQALRLSGTAHLAQPACWALHSCLFAPIAHHTDLSMGACQSEIVDRFMLMFALVVVGIIVPVQLSYWHEYTCKRLFLQNEQLQSSGASSSAHRSRTWPLPVSPALVLFHVWISCALAWFVSHWWVRNVAEPLGKAMRANMCADLW